MKTLRQHILDLSYSSALEIIRRGEARAGHIGPYEHPETPVRNTSHWLFAFASCFEWSADDVFKKAALVCYEYLESDSARPMNASFYCRVGPDRDACNGLVGQAWAIEALCYASKVFDWPEARELAKTTYQLHPWIAKDSIWRRVACDGTRLSTDDTFNHQLWFAAAAAQLEDKDATHCVEAFLSNVVAQADIYPDGVIYHASKLGYRGWRARGVSARLDGMINAIWRMKNKGSLYSKSVGYHSFNLYALAMLYQKFPGHSYWSSKKFEKSLSVVAQDSFLKELNKSQYSWPYNPPGIEIAFALETFGRPMPNCQTWIDRQVLYSFGKTSGSITAGCSSDVYTNEARIYEAARLKNDYMLKIDDAVDVGFANIHDRLELGAANVALLKTVNE